MCDKYEYILKLLCILIIVFCVLGFIQSVNLYLTIIRIYYNLLFVKTDKTELIYNHYVNNKNIKYYSLEYV